MEQQIHSDVRKERWDHRKERAGRRKLGTTTYYLPLQLIHQVKTGLNEMASVTTLIVDINCGGNKEECEKRREEIADIWSGQQTRVASA